MKNSDQSMTCQDLNEVRSENQQACYCLVQNPVVGLFSGCHSCNVFIAAGCYRLEK